MRYAFTTILLAPRFGWQPAPTRQERRSLYARVAEMGFEGIEWSPRWCDFEGLSRAEVASLSDELNEFGLVISAINLNRFMLTGTPESVELLRRLRSSIEVAKLLSCERIIVSLSMPKPPDAVRKRLIGGSVSDVEFRQVAKLLAELADAAAKQNVTLILELHDDGLLDTPELCLRMLDLIGRENVALNPDLGNFIRNPPFNSDWRTALRQLAPRTGYWHLKNYQMGQPSPIWEGDIHYAEAIEIMRRADFHGWCSIESYYGENPLELQEPSLRWLREQLAQKPLEATR